MEMLNLLIVALFILILLRKRIKSFLKDIRSGFELLDRFAGNDIYEFGFPGFRFAIVNDPKLLQKVFSSDACLEKPRLIYKLLGTKSSLVTEPYAQWRQDRRYFSSCFNNAMLESFIPLFSLASDRMTESIKEAHIDGTEFNVQHYLDKCVVELVCAATFDVRLEQEDYGDVVAEQIIETMNQASSIFVRRMKNPFLLPDPIFHMTASYKKDNENRNYIFQMLLDFIANGNLDQSDATKQNIFMHKLLRLRSKLGDEEMKDHILAIGAAAFDALATSASYCVLFLAMHPEIQQKAFDEVSKTFEESSTISLEKLSKLEYLGMVIKETMRLVPGVHGIAREAMADVELSPKQKLRKGTIILINIFMLHRRKDVWGTDAEKFNPERFGPEKVNNYQNCYIPFSAGKRNCIGEKYATCAFKIIIAKLLLKFKFETSLKLGDLKFDRQIAIKLLNGHMVRVKSRD